MVFKNKYVLFATILILIVFVILILNRFNILNINLLGQSALLGTQAGDVQLLVLPQAPVVDGYFIDFSDVPCCSVLTYQYFNSYPASSSLSGVIFNGNTKAGWASQQANGFVTHLSVASTTPGAPAGITGTEVMLGKPSSLAGVMVQSGSPFDANANRPEKRIRVVAYDKNNSVLLDKETNTCGSIPTTAGSCPPVFIGVISPVENIAKLQYIILEPYNFSLDDLYFEQNTGLLYGSPRINVEPITFSEFSGSGVLTDQLVGKDLIFTNSPTTGFLTSYGNGFITGASGPIQEPGAPKGITGTEITIANGTAKRIGFYIQQGTPFNDQVTHARANIRIIALDKNNNELLNELIDTCVLEKGSSCLPQFVGIYNKYGEIKKVQIIKESDGFYSIDNLYLEKKKTGRGGK